MRHPATPPRPSAVRAAGSLAMVALLGALVLLAGVARADKGENEGIYRDREGKDHPWSIGRNHLLTWEGAPYTPAGVVFHSAYLAKPTPETLKQDETELERLRGAGIQDIWVDSGAGLLSSSPAQTQKLIDALETRGFRYGLRVGDRFQAPLVGYSPALPITRVPASVLRPNGQANWEVRAPRARRLLYALVEGSPNERTLGFPIAGGEVVVEGDTGQIEVRFRNSRRLGRSRGLLYTIPEIQVEPDELGSFGDLWGGMEAYIGKLRTQFRGLKFGPGLRFVLDPFSAGDGTVGQEDAVFPSSDAFRTAFQDWLARRSGVNTLNQQWRTNDRAIEGMEEASRLVPTWSPNDPPEGDGWLLDPVEKTAYRCNARQCTIWQDLENFRAESLKKWMNVAAINLEQDGLNVPVLFSWGSYHPIFNNKPSPSGYDGLCAQLYGTPESVALAAGGYALAQAEEADRNSWLVALRLAGPMDSADQPSPIADASQARALWGAVREVGMRGVYFDPEQTPNAVELARDLSTGMTGDLEAMRARIPICFFPIVMSAVDRVSRLSNGVWWLPSAAPARLIRYGDSILGYEMAQPLGDEHPVKTGTVLWSTSGTQEVTFFVDRFTQVALYNSAGAALKPRIKKEKLQVTLTGEPLIAVGVEATALFPVELATQQLREFDELLRQAEAKKADTASLRVIYNQAEKSLTTANAALTYNSITPYVVALRQTLAPFLWVEAERPLAHNFSGVSYQAGASRGLLLKLDRKEPPISGLFRARYVIDISKDGSYDIWVAGKVPGRPGISPLTWQIDEEPANTVETAQAVGGDFAGGIAWFQLGRATLQPGRHELTLVTPRRAPGENGRYVAAFDSIVLSRDAFQPNGAEKPYNRARDARVAAGDKGKPGDRPKAAAPPANQVIEEKGERKPTPEKQPAQPLTPDLKPAPPRGEVGGAVIDVDEKTGRRLPSDSKKKGAKKGKKPEDGGAPAGDAPK